MKKAERQASENLPGQQVGLYPIAPLTPVQVVRCRRCIVGSRAGGIQPGPLFVGCRAESRPLCAAEN